MSESSRRKKLALAGIQETPEEIKKREEEYQLHKLRSKAWRKAGRIIRGKWNHALGEI